jgi:hypothetical protein
MKAKRADPEWEQKRVTTFKANRAAKEAPAQPLSLPNEGEARRFLAEEFASPQCLSRADLADRVAAITGADPEVASAFTSLVLDQLRAQRAQMRQNGQSTGTNVPFGAKNGHLQAEAVPA